MFIPRYSKCQEYCGSHTLIMMQKFENYRLFKQPMSSFYSRTDFNNFALKANKTDDGTTTHCSRLI